MPYLAFPIERLAQTQWPVNYFDSRILKGLTRLCQQVSRCKKISDLEALGEPVVNRSENSFSFVLPILLYPHMGEAERRSQFPKKGLLFSSQSDRTEETPFGCRHRLGCRMPQHHLAFDAKEFGNRVTLATVFGGSQGFLDGDERLIELPQPG